MLSPIPAFSSAAIGAVVGRTTRSPERGIQVGYAAYPVLQVLVDGTRRTAATGGLMTVIGVRFWLAARRTGGRARRVA